MGKLQEYNNYYKSTFCFIEIQLILSELKT
jgi:hypothetical protein